MAMLSPRLPLGVESVQVWPELDADRRQRAISVVAQMAFNLIQTQATSLQPEENDDHGTTIDEAAQ
jgi:hypothetical protein